jgi:PKD repeat protein
MHWRSLRHPAAVFAAAFSFVICGPSPARADESSPLCTNLAGLTDWSGEWPFVDAFKTSRPWISGQRFGCWDCAGPLDLDEHGWVRSLNTGAPNGGQVARTLMFVGQAGRYPAGTYTVLYDGQGTLEYAGAARKDAAASGPGRDVVQVNPASGDFMMTLVATTPANYLRNVRVLMPGGACENDPLTACGGDAACGSGRCLPFTQTYQAQVFHPTFLRSVGRYRALRFMDWMGTNGSTVQEPADYPKLDDARWPQAPPEILAELGNRVDADVWVTLPVRASDAFVRDFAERLRLRLEPRRKVYVEYSNEVWNTIFPQHGETARRGCGRYPELVAACDQDQAPGNGRLCEGHPGRWIEACATASRRYFSERSVAIGSLFTEAFGGRERVVRVMASQTGNTWLANELLSWRNAWQQVDALATAPYFGGGYGTRGEVASWTLDRLLGDIQGNALPQSIADMRAEAGLLAQRYPSLSLLGYEGGQHLVGVNGLENDAALNALFDGANSDARMGSLYTSYLGGWKAAGGRTFCHFVNTSQWSKWGRWGALRYQGQPPASSPKFTALMGFVDANRCWWPGCDGTGGNVPPVARPGGPYRGTRGTAVSFDGRASSDSDGSLTGYAWYFGDGSTGTGATPQHTYDRAGAFTVRLAVTDDGGATGTAATSATIEDVPTLPDVVVADLSYANGSFTSTVRNQGTGPTPAGVDIGVAYFVDDVYRTWGSVRGPLAAGASVVIGSQGGSFIIPPGTHTVRAWVDDINRFRESSENNNQLSRPITVVPADTVPPVISNPLPRGTLPAGTTSTTMAVTTDEAATCRWGTSPATSYASLPNAFATTGGTAHATTLGGLADGQSFVRYVRCLDRAGNANPASTAVSFSVASPAADVLWRDSIQTAAAAPWGFSQIAVEHPIGTRVTPGDGSGANLSRVANPLPGGGFALRHFATFDNGGTRSQAGIYSFANPAFERQAKSPEGVWVAQEWYFPQAITARGDAVPWLNLWDWHSTASGGNRWHTAPGLMLAEDGSLRVRWEWGGPAGALNPTSAWSSIPLPVGEWFDIEMHYRWSAGRTTLTLWINGVQALQQANVQTRAAAHDTVETYVKFYGSRNGGTPWSPTPTVKYTRNVRVAGQRIWRP